MDTTTHRHAPLIFRRLTIQPDPEGVLATSIDITEQKQHEEALRHSKALLRPKDLGYALMELVAVYS